jgi:hypothetical protein
MGHRRIIVPATHKERPREVTPMYLAPPYARYFCWVIMKNIQVWIRKQLSHWLAIVLAIAVSYREHHEFVQFYYDVVCHMKPSLFDVFVASLLIATIVAAIWEIWGNKLSTSPQEIRFLRGMRSLLLEMEAMVFAGKMSQEEAGKRFDEFVRGFLRITSSTLCAHEEVDAGLMMKTPDRDSLRRTHVSDAAKFKVGFEIPLPATPDSEKKSGPGGISFHRAKLVYMPSVKKRKEAWPLALAELSDPEHETYALDGIPIVAWIDDPEPKHQDFSSMLCAPVGKDRNGKTRYGVLEYTTEAKDPFVDRDFMMAECFASILSQAAKITVASNEPPPSEQPPQSQESVGQADPIH